MLIIEKDSIVSFFKKLNESLLKYVLIRNINDELPYSLTVGKDIDLLVNYSDRRQIYKFLKENGFKKIKHPHRNNVFLYGLHKFEFFKHKNGLILDLNFRLVCRSLDKGQWLPLDQIIQDSAWDNRRKFNFSEELNYWSLSKEDEFITLVVRSIFDKRSFQKGYIIRIEELIEVIDKEEVIKKFKLVFFNYSIPLLEQLKKKSYNNIIENYFQFNKY